MSILRSPVLVLIAVLPFAGCTRDTSDARGDLSTVMSLVQSDSSGGIDLAGFAARQQAFLRAMTETNADAGVFVTPGFLFSDWSAPRPPVRRDITGRTMPPTNYFQSVSTRIEPIYATIESMEVRKERGQVLVIARHPNAHPSITRWHQVDGEWKVGMLTLNVPEDVMTRMFGRGPTAGS